jgi:predicted nucleotidyltransferase
MTADPRVDPILAEFIERIEPVRSAIERIVLFGSRARRDHRPDSDYDVLVVVGQRDDRLVDVLYDSVMDILLAHGRLISLKIMAQAELARLQALGAPFVTRIAAEGVPVG